MAQLHARGELDLTVPFVHESIIGSRFTGTLMERITHGGIDMVRPVIEGRAFIIAQRRMLLDPEDGFSEGFGVGYASDAARPAAQMAG